MVSSQFGGILKEFENFFNCTLEPDSHDSCLISMEIGINLQVELDRYGMLLIGCRLGAVHMGRYRDNLIRAALKSNETTFPSTGVIGFSQKSNQLILFVKVSSHNFTANDIATLLPPFVTKAKLWMDAIAKGEVPSLTTAPSSKAPSGLFGLIS